MSYSVIVGDLEPDMTIETDADLDGATSLVLRWKTPDDEVDEVDMIGADTDALVVVNDTVESTSTSLNTLTLTAHGLLTGDGPVQFTTDGTLPAGIALVTDYWIIKVSANAISLAETRGGAVVDITDTGSGTHTLVDTADTARVDLTTGRVTRVWEDGDTDQEGTHYGQVVATMSNGELETFPNEGTLFIWNLYAQLA